MPRMNALSNYATTIAASDGATRVTYHSTIIVEWDADIIALRTGGYDTVTTRRKMQQVANQFGLGFRVFRNKGVTYVEFNGQEAILGQGARLRRHPKAILHA